MTQILLEEPSNFAKNIDVFGKISKRINFYKVSCFEEVLMHVLSLFFGPFVVMSLEIKCYRHSFPLSYPNRSAVIQLSV